MRRLAIIALFILTFFISCKGENLYSDYVNKTVEIKSINNKTVSYGTGTLISNDGKILTNKHVIEGYTSFEVRYANSDNVYNALLISKSSEYDLAILKVELKTEYFKKITDEFTVGEEIYSLGNAGGYGLTFYKGIINSSYKNLIENNISHLVVSTNMEIYDGCSGGPVYNKDGNLLGIITLRVRDKSSNYIPGISYMTPSKCILEYLCED